jgi:hypothetical protein
MVLLSELAAHLESGRRRIISTPMGQELIAEMNAFEVDYTASGTMKVDFEGRITTATCDRNGARAVVGGRPAIWAGRGR